MIRKITPSFVVFAALVTTVVGAEPQSLLPMQPQLPPSPRLLHVSQTTPAGTAYIAQPALTPVPESSHDKMLASESCYSDETCGDCQGQPVPVATWWANTWAGRLYHSIADDTKKANEWPEPYIQYDREATRVAFTTMTEKGWKRQNTLGDVHFDNQTGDLNMSGRLKVQRIVLEGLPSRRDLFVYRAETMQKTDVRMNSVKGYVEKLVGNGPNIPQVSVTNLPTPGWPAQYVDAISRKYVETMPDPRIPDKTDAAFTEE